MALTRQKCEDFWKAADVNNDGQLSKMELVHALKKYFQVEDSRAAGMFCDVDKDDDEKISKGEFLNEMLNLEKRSDYFAKMWKKYDRDGSGQLTRAEVFEIIRDRYPPDQKNRVIGEFLSHCDLNSDGFISKPEFDKFFC